MKRHGFTIIEVIITLVITTILMASISFTYLTVNRAFNAGEGRSQARNQLSQAIDSITRNLYLAQDITVCNATTLTFYANFGNAGDPAIYSYSLAYNSTNKNYDLHGTTGAVIVSGLIQPQGTVVSWGTTPALFKCSYAPVNGVVPALVSLDMTAVSNGVSKSGVLTGETVHIQKYVQPRNMPVGLVGWWSFNDGSGTTAADLSGLGNNGSLINVPSWTTGHISGGWVSGLLGSGALGFAAASSQYVTMGNIAVTDGASSAAWSAWIKSTLLPGAYAEIISKWDGSSQDHFSLRVNSSGGVCAYIANALNDGGSNYACTAAGAITTGNWYHILVSFNGALTGNGNKLAIYVTKAASGLPMSQTFLSAQALTFTGTIPSSLDSGATSPYDIGAYNNANDYFNGSIDDVRVYDRALNAGEVAQIFNGE